MTTANDLRGGGVAYEMRADVSTLSGDLQRAKAEFGKLEGGVGGIGTKVGDSFGKSISKALVAAVGVHAVDNMLRVVNERLRSAMASGTAIDAGGIGMAIGESILEGLASVPVAGQLGKLLAAAIGGGNIFDEDRLANIRGQADAIAKALGDIDKATERIKSGDAGPFATALEEAARLRSALDAALPPAPAATVANPGHVSGQHGSAYGFTVPNTVPSPFRPHGHQSGVTTDAAVLAAHSRGKKISDAVDAYLAAARHAAQAKADEAMSEALDAMDSLAGAVDAEEQANRRIKATADKIAAMFRDIGEPGLADAVLGALKARLSLAKVRKQAKDVDDRIKSMNEQATLAGLDDFQRLARDLWSKGVPFEKIEEALKAMARMKRAQSKPETSFSAAGTFDGGMAAAKFFSSQGPIAEGLKGISEQLKDTLDILRRLGSGGTIWEW